MSDCCDGAVQVRKTPKYLRPFVYWYERKIAQWEYEWKYKVCFWLKKPKCNYVLHAERELKALGYNLDDPENGPNKWIQENLIELLEVLSSQGHSGGSIGYCVNTFSKLALFEPLSPLQGTDEEWNDTSEYGLGHEQGEVAQYQNNRASHVFKTVYEDGTVRTYDIQGKVFEEPNGSRWGGSGSAVDITFPYTPKTEVVYICEGCECESRPCDQAPTHD